MTRHITLAALTITALVAFDRAASAQAVAYHHRSTVLGDHLAGASELVRAQGAFLRDEAEAAGMWIRNAASYDALQYQRREIFFQEKQLYVDYLKAKAEAKRERQAAEAVGGHPTGLPAGAGIVAYGAAYRMVAGSTQSWPANAPPGAWGQLLEHCLRVRASERIADGVTLAERCDQAGDFATSRRPEPAEPADPLAPTAEVSPPRATPPASADRAARAQALTEHQAVVASPREREGITNDAVVKPLELAAAPKAETQLSAPLATPAQKASSKAVPIAIGALVLAVAGSVAAFAFWPAPDPSRPLVPTATQAPIRSAAPLATTAIIAPEAAAEDAPSEATAESPTRPPGCSADRPVCECCLSGRDCAPGRCDDDLNPEDDWHLRLGRAEIDGMAIDTSASNAELCVHIVRPRAVPTCMKLSTLDTNNAKLLYVTYGDLQGHGVEFELRTDTDAGTRALRAKLKGKLTRLALCRGIELDQFSAVDPGGVASAKLLVFLDSPTAPPEKCAPREPVRSQ